MYNSSFWCHHNWLFSLQEVDAKPQSLLIEYIKENSWVKILQAYLGAYGLVKVSKDNLFSLSIIIMPQYGPIMQSYKKENVN